MPPVNIRIQEADFDIGTEIGRVTAGRADIGAVVTFSGHCRDEDGTLRVLELEHYPGMAEAEIRRICDTACQRWPLHALTVIHRHGAIAPGRQIVLVIAASAHRQPAFDAAAYVMDFLKSKAPFWKKAHGHDGDKGEWIDAREADAEALDRWRAAEPE